MSASVEALEGIVPLHELCGDCINFSRNWEFLDAVQRSENLSSQSWSVVSLYTVAHLREVSRECHFCSMLLASLEDHVSSFMASSSFKKNVKREKDMTIYLRAGLKKEYYFVDAICDFESPVNGSRYEENHFDAFSIRTYSHSDFNLGFHQHISAKSVPLQARFNFNRAKSWIESCLQHHKKCHNFNVETADPCQRPTRVLEITGTTARLRCDMRTEAFEYLVLSHMWGKKTEKQLRLLEDNLSDFQEEIPWNELTATITFREAIRITSALGYRYLWIDSLCIIQNSKSDWKQEASRMAIVYGNAVCNISYLFPSDTACELINRKEPRAWNPCILREVTSASPGIYIERGERRQDWLAQHTWPLFSRAWTFQEYLLSPRTLLVGHKNLIFQCSELFYDELLGPIGDGHGQVVDEKKAHNDEDFSKSRYFPASIKAVSAVSHLSEVTALSFVVDWWKIVNEYRTRELTKPSDRVIAFAGIARAFHRLGGLTYLAGLWKECLPLCLLWFIYRKGGAAPWKEPNHPPGTVISSDLEVLEFVEQPAPTWSWFSVPIFASHRPTFLLLEDDVLAENELSVRRKVNRDPSIVCFDDIFWASTPSFQFQKEPENHFPESGFFDFENLSITLYAQMLPVSVNWPADLSAQTSVIQASVTSVEDREFECEPRFKYYPDAVDERNKNPPKDGIYALMIENQIVRPAGKYRIQRRFYGLILMAGEVEGTWERVGAWKLKMRIWDVDVTPENMNDVARRWKEYKFVSDNWKKETLVLV